MNKKGFTLVELLAVIAILAILVIMAVPAVIKTFNKSRIDTFNNELNTIIKAAQHQYILDGEAKIYSNSSNPLRVTNNSDFNYCITVNADGEIIDFKATNGSYKYESDGVVEETSSSDITEIDGNFSLECSPFKYVTRQNEGQITVGDEVSIDTEHFYVISSNSTNTVLLAKYNLLVGNVFNSSDGGSTWSFAKTLSSSDAGYGLQSETAKAYYSGGTDRTGVVAFSGSGYWDNGDCIRIGEGHSFKCPGIEGLKSEYANSANAAGKTGYYSDPRPYVYNSSMSNVAPSYVTYTDSNGAWKASENNGYTIAYYVERYVNTLKQMGAPSGITGRLLTNEEAISLSSTIRGNWSYWIDEACNSQYVYMSTSASSISAMAPWLANSGGVRSVIVVPTNSMPN